MNSHKDLIVWQKSITLVTSIYKLTNDFPESESFGLVSQMRRCAVSIPSNVAEGNARRGDAESDYFLKVAYGSTAELDTQLIIAKKLGFLPETEFDTVQVLLVEVRKILNTLIAGLKAKN